MVMKFIPILALLVATEVNSCNDSGVVQRMREQSQRAETACVSHGGVPIFQSNKDTASYVHFETVARCDFPPVAPTLRGER